MASLKALNGAAHDLAHHSQSFFSWLHPHMAEECRRAGVTMVTVEFSGRSTYPRELAHSVPLASALIGLERWFADLLMRQGYVPADVSSASLTFEFRQNGGEDDYNPTVSCTIVARTGREFVHTVRAIVDSGLRTED